MEICEEEKKHSLSLSPKRIFPVGKSSWALAMQRQAKQLHPNLPLKMVLSAPAPSKQVDCTCEGLSMRQVRGGEKERKGEFKLGKGANVCLVCCGCNEESAE